MADNTYSPANGLGEGSGGVKVPDVEIPVASLEGSGVASAADFLTSAQNYTDSCEPSRA
jgi:hypothetical protein